MSTVTVELPQIGDHVTAWNGGVRWKVISRFKYEDGVERMDLVSPRGARRNDVPAGSMRIAPLR